MTAIFATLFLVSGCASAALDGAGSLSSYDGLKQSDGLFAKSKLTVNKDEVLAARTVRIVPTIFAVKARVEGVTDEQRKLIVNAVDRSLCAGLSERFTVVTTENADLTVYALVTQMTPTDEKAVAATKAASVAKSVLLPGVPVPTPRLPIGLGTLSMEAEARSRDGRQQAAMVWGRGANAFFGTARISPSGDAYEFASAFGDDFSKLLVKGKSPFGTLPSAPSFDRIQSLAGGSPKYDACAAFGREPGLVGLVGGVVGAPPEWTDKGSGSEERTASAPAQ